MFGLLLLIVVVALPFIAGVALLVWGLATRSRTTGFVGEVAATCGAAVLALWVLAAIVNRALLAVVRGLVHMPQVDIPVGLERWLYVVAYAAFLALGLMLILRPAGITSLLTTLLPRNVRARMRDEASSRTISVCLRILGVWAVLAFVLMVAGAFGVLFAI